MAKRKRKSTKRPSRWIALELKLARAQDRYDKLVQELNEVHHECARAMAIWNDAHYRRTRLATEKTNAWGELQMARAAVDGAKRRKR